MNNLIMMLLYLRDSYVDKAYYISFMNNTIQSSIRLFQYNNKLYSNGHTPINPIDGPIDGYKLISVMNHTCKVDLYSDGSRYHPQLLQHYQLLLDSNSYDRKKYSILNMQSLNSDIRFISNVIVNVKNDDDYLIRIVENE